MLPSQVSDPIGFPPAANEVGRSSPSVQAALVNSTEGDGSGGEQVTNSDAVDHCDDQEDQESERLALEREWRERILTHAPHALANSTPAEFLAMIAHDSFQSFQAQGQLIELEKTIAMYDIALQLLPAIQSEVRQHVLVYLGTSLCMQSEWTDDDGLVERAVQLLEEAVECDPPSSISLQYLAIAYRLRHTRTGALADLDSAIQLRRDILALRGSGTIDRPATLTNLGAELQIRFSRTGNAADLDEAIQLLHEAVELRGPLPSASRLISLHALSNAIDGRFKYRKDIKDLEEANALRQIIFELCCEESIASPVLLARIGDSFQNIYDTHGDIKNLENAVTLGRRAVQIASEQDPGRMEFSVKLEKALYRRFEQLGAAADLDETIEIAGSVVDAPAASIADKALALSDLAFALTSRFENRGTASDLDVAVDLARRSLSMRQLPDDKDLHISINILAYILLARFKYRGAMSDLEDCLQLYWKELDLIPEGHPLHFETLSNLANALLSRFAHLANVGDLNEAVKMHEKSVELCPPGHQQRGLSINNLANVLIDRFQYAAAPSDLEKALELRREALKYCPPGHYFRHACLHNLATTLSFRVNWSKSYLSDDVAGRRLGEAVEIFNETLELRVPGHPDRPTSMIALGHTYEQLFDRFEKDSDASTALRLMSDAFELLPVGHVRRSKCRFRMSRLYTVGPQEDLRTAVDCFLDAVSDTCLNPQSRLLAAIETLGEIERRYLHAGHSRHQLLLEAYLATLRLLPAVAYFGLDIQSRLQALQKAETLTLNGAAHALAVSRPETALEMLDEGRGLFWTQALRLRTPFDSAPLELSQKLADLARQLETDSFDSRGAELYRTAPNPSSDREAARRRRLSEEFDSLVDEVRATSGFEDFMRRPRFETLAHAADQGPVIVLLASVLSCEAILLTADGVAKRVPLPTVTVDRLAGWNVALKSDNQDKRNTMDEYEAYEERALLKVLHQKEGTKDVLEQLWTEVAKVVIDALQLETGTGRSRPRLWWCPTGQFTFLPIHAAGFYQSLGDCCSDYAISSYTPTLGALLNARQALSPIPRESAKVLLAAVPYPYRGNRLPYTAKETESVKEVLPAANLLSVDFSSGVSVRDLLDNLPQATILHLASHGYQDPQNPLDSGFLMSDDILTVSKLMPLPLPRAFLAFLSACETAKGDQKQPDQTVHLAATMLFAGFKSVVGTLWSMSDVDGPVVAAAVYQNLFRGDSAWLDPEAVPYAIDEVIRAMRARGLHPSRWAPYIHIGV